MNDIGKSTDMNFAFYFSFQCFFSVSLDRVIKLILLEFVNNFLSLFYIAFYLGEPKIVQSQLMTQLIVFQVIEWNVFEYLMVIKFHVLVSFISDCSKIYGLRAAVDNAEIVSIQKFNNGRNNFGLC